MFLQDIYKISYKYIYSMFTSNRVEIYIFICY